MNTGHTKECNKLIKESAQYWEFCGKHEISCDNKSLHLCEKDECDSCGKYTPWCKGERIGGCGYSYGGCYMDSYVCECWEFWCKKCLGDNK